MFLAATCMATTAIAMHPICIQSVFNDWPKDDNTYVGCGTMTAETFISNSGGKNTYYYPHYFATTTQCNQ